MKKIILLLLIVVIGAQNASAEEIKIVVKGMVCSFCAQGIKKAFAKLPEVEEVTPDLSKKTVLIKTRADQTISDAQIASLIADAGYDLVSIERAK